MEDCFQKEGYILLKNSYTNLLYKFLSFKILRKVKIFFKLVFRCKFFFKEPEHNKIVIFDSHTTHNIEKILPNKNYKIISTRIEEINEIYFSKKIIFYIIRNFFKRSVKQNYLSGLIKAIAPKVVLTEIEYSPDFHIISKILHSEIEWFAIQLTGTPYIFTFMSEEMRKNFFYSPAFLS